MEPTERIEFQLPKDLIDSMNEAVASGGYATTNDVASIALRYWQMQRQWAINDLRRLVDEGIASGIAPDCSIEDIIAEAKKRKKS